MKAVYVKETKKLNVSIGKFTRSGLVTVEKGEGPTKVKIQLDHFEDTEDLHIPVADYVNKSLKQGVEYVLSGFFSFYKFRHDKVEDEELKVEGLKINGCSV